MKFDPEGKKPTKDEYPEELEVARQHVKFLMNIEVGLDGGSFVYCLIEAMIHADNWNLTKLGLVYPWYYQAFREWKSGELV